MNLNSRSTDQPGSLTPIPPVISLPQTSPRIVLPPTISIPTVGPVSPTLTLPSVNVRRQNLPTVTLPSVYLPTINLSSYGSVDTFMPTSLADNEVGDLRWNRPNPPRPISINSAYKRVGCIGDGSCFFHAFSKGLSEIYQLSYRTFIDVSEETLVRFEQAVNSAITFPSTLFTTPRNPNLSTHYNFAQPYGQTAFTNLLRQFRGAYVRVLRQDFANKVLNDNKMQSIIRNRLTGSIDLITDTLMSQGGNKPREQVQNQAFQQLLTTLSQDLLSGNAVEPSFMLLISDFVGIDIYLLRDADLINPDPRNSPLYSGASLHTPVYGPSDMRSRDDPYARMPNRPSLVIISIDDFHYEIVARVDEFKDDEGINRKIVPNMTPEEPLIRRLYEILLRLRKI